MIIANISIDDEQVTSFMFENEGSLSLELNGNAELTDLEQQVIEKYANEIARIVRNGLVRMINSQQEESEE